MQRPYRVRKMGSRIGKQKIFIAVAITRTEILAPLKFSHGKNLGVNGHSPLLTSGILRFSCCYKNHAIAKFQH